LRLDRGWSQERLAHEASVTIRTVQKIEHHESNPTWTTVAGIAGALDVTMADIGALVDKLDRRR
jgi:transcriptional regulator with XRE-family HTH domain